MKVLGRLSEIQPSQNFENSFKWDIKAKKAALFYGKSPLKLSGRASILVAAGLDERRRGRCFGQAAEDKSIAFYSQLWMLTEVLLLPFMSAVSTFGQQLD